MTAPARPTCSVALCTYNGRAYLPAQWQSLLDQQQCPDEVVVCDDQSTDGTAELLRQLAADAPFSVRVLENPVRLGYKKNFEQALSKCTGDLIFLCDQDDGWLPEKIGTMTDYMMKNPAIQLAFCDAWVTDEHLQGREQRFWEVVRFDQGAKDRWRAGNALDVLLDGNRVMGAATVIRRAFLPMVLPFPADDAPGYVHDEWMALVAAACGVIGFVDQPLQLYRTHVQQQIGVREPDAKERVRLRDRLARRRVGKLAPLREKQARLVAIEQHLAERIPTDTPGMPLLHRRLSHFTMRSHLPTNRLRRLWLVLTNLRQGNYHRYADQWANGYAPYLAALGDILE